jgi:hypothetical protein
MPNAAGIIMATGIMTMVNDMVQDDSGSLNVPATAMVDNIPWRVIPATAIAAGIFYGIEQMNASVAKALAALAFVTAFTLPKYDIVDQFGNATGAMSQTKKTSPLGTLLKVTGNPGGAVFIKGIN